MRCSGDITAARAAAVADGAFSERAAVWWNSTAPSLLRALVRVRLGSGIDAVGEGSFSERALLRFCAIESNSTAPSLLCALVRARLGSGIDVVGEGSFSERVLLRCCAIESPKDSLRVVVCIACGDWVVGPPGLSGADLL